MNILYIYMCVWDARCHFHSQSMCLRRQNKMRKKKIWKLIIDSENWDRWAWNFIFLSDPCSNAQKNIQELDERTDTAQKKPISLMRITCFFAQTNQTPTTIGSNNHYFNLITQMPMLLRARIDTTIVHDWHGRFSCPCPCPCRSRNDNHNNNNNI